MHGLFAADKQNSSAAAIKNAFWTGSRAPSRRAARLLAQGRAHRSPHPRNAHGSQLIPASGENPVDAWACRLEPQAHEN